MSKWFNSFDFFLVNLLKMTLERSDSDCIGDPLELQLLQMVVKMIGAKKTLDIGENGNSRSIL